MKASAPAEVVALPTTTEPSPETAQASLKNEAPIRSLPERLRPQGDLRIPINHVRGFAGGIQKLVDTQWFQRLRKIRQLGIAHLVFPGAVHTRFEHSLGSFAQTVEYAGSLLQNGNSPWFSFNFEDDDIVQLSLVALLHDIGHFPYEHQLEDIPGLFPSHEEISYEIIRR